MPETTERCLVVGTIEGGGYEKCLEANRRVYAIHGTAPTQTCKGGGKRDTKIMEELKIYDAYNHMDITDKGSIGTLSTTTNHGSGNCGTFYVGEPHYRIRKLTERECFRLMGVKDEDSALIASHQAKTSQYHLAGDSIVTSCLMAIFGEMCGVDWRKAVDELVDSISRKELTT